jgi:capsid protein
VKHLIPKHPPLNVQVRARYDAAQTTTENQRLWSAADAYDADTANNIAVRMILRNRCRYVFANNSRARGMIKTLATHTVGPSGPRLQMQLGDGVQARKLNSRIEGSFAAWAKTVKLARKLRTLRKSKVVSGEVFVKLVINPGLEHDVKLDLQLIETDQVTNPAPAFTPDDIDGIFLDEFGNPASYRILKVHPGGLVFNVMPTDYDDVSARFVRHYFDQEDRPGQHRGIPEIASAVQVFEEGRRFRAAVLGAAETAADFAMAMETDASADPDGAEASADSIPAMSTMELERRMATVLPRGFKLTQTKAEQPTTTYKEFSRELLSEVARCIGMPLSFASLDANDANMSAMYVITQPYQKEIESERWEIDCEILDPLIDVWLTLFFGSSDTSMTKRIPSEFPHLWYWPSIGQHADPGKVAAARDINLKNHSTTLALEFASVGLDWEEQLEQAAKEKKYMKELGLELTEAAAPLANPQQSGAANDQANQADPATDPATADSAD